MDLLVEKIHHRRRRRRRHLQASGPERNGKFFGAKMNLRLTEKLSTISCKYQLTIVAFGLFSQFGFVYVVFAFRHCWMMMDLNTNYTEHCYNKLINMAAPARHSMEWSRIRVHRIAFLVANGVARCNVHMTLLTRMRLQCTLCV